MFVHTAKIKNGYYVFVCTDEVFPLLRNILLLTYFFKKDSDINLYLLISFQNKTKVDIRFHLESASWLTPDVKEILKMKYPNQLTKDGFLVVKSDRTRSRLLNQADALQKLRHFIWAAIDDVRTYLERTQIDQVEMEKQIKAQEKASRERLKAKRTKSMYKNDRKGIEY